MTNSIALPIKSDYRINDDAYVKSVEHAGRVYDVEIGDQKQKGRFYPQLKTKLFDNQANLSVRYLSDDDQTTPHVEKDMIVWENDKERAEIYELERGFEFSVVLKEKPADEYLKFSLQHKNLIFCKQGEITQKEAKELGVSLKEARAGRPENVVNSYAVYHDPRNTDVTQINNYKTGKAFHIYRPWAEDDSGNRVWCDIDIIDDIMIVTLPLEFYRTAKYPLLVDPTFGYSSQGATEVTIGDVGASGMKIILADANKLLNAPAGKSVSKLSMYVRAVTGTGTVEVGAYDLGDLSLLGKTTLSFASTDAVLVENSVSLALTATNDYTLAFGNTEDSGVEIKGFYDTPGGTTMVRGSPETGALPDPFVLGGGVSQLFSLFATYGDAAAAPTFNGAVPNYSGPRTTPVVIKAGTYFDNADSYSVANLPAGAAFSTTTGELTWASPTNGAYSNIQITAANALGTADSNTFSITVNAQSPVLIEPINNMISSKDSAIASFDASTHFDFGASFAATELPEGLSVSALGVISGTPTEESGFSTYVTATNSDGSTNSNTFLWTIGAALPIPTVSSVNSGNHLQRSQTITITGSNFGGTQGSGSVEFNNTALTVTSWANTSISVVVPDEGFIFGAIHALIVENDAGYSVTLSEQFVPGPGYSYTTLSVNYAGLPSDSFMYGQAALGSLAVGDQVSFQSVASPQGTLTIDGFGVAVISGAGVAGNYTFNYMINDVSDLTVSSNGTAVVTYAGSDDDVNAPNWATAPAVSNIVENGLTVTAAISEIGNIGVVIVPTDELTPSPTQVLAGQNALGGEPSASAAITDGTSISELITGLDDGSPYKVCFAAEDDETPANIQASVSVIIATTLKTPDLTPPEFIRGPTVSAVTQSGAVLNAEINESGTVFAIIIDAIHGDPSSPEVILGYYTNESGGSVNPAVVASASEFNNYSISNLAAGKAYKACFAARDSANNAQQAPTIISFTTSQAGSIRSLTETLKDERGSAIASRLLDWQVQDEWGVMTDRGQLTTDANGEFTLTDLQASPLGAYLFVKDPADQNVLGAYPVSIVES